MKLGMCTDERHDRIVTSLIHKALKLGSFFIYNLEVTFLYFEPSLLIFM